MCQRSRQIISHSHDILFDVLQNMTSPHPFPLPQTMSNNCFISFDLLQIMSFVVPPCSEILVISMNFGMPPCTGVLVISFALLQIVTSSTEFRATSVDMLQTMNFGVPQCTEFLVISFDMLQIMNCNELHAPKLWIWVCSPHPPPPTQCHSQKKEEQNLRVAFLIFPSRKMILARK